MNHPPSMSGETLEIRRLRKTYGTDVVANDDISLDVRPGEVFGLLGPNGAGKTTLVNQCIGLLKPTAGTIQMGEVDLVARPAAARQLCSYLPQAPLPIDSFSVEQAVRLVGQIRGGGADAVRRRADELIETLELTEWRSKLGRKLSGGVLRLVGFLTAAVWPGRILILDEPTNDVDPLRRRLLWHEIRRIADNGTSVMLVTHNVLEAERVVDRLAVIDGAKIVAEGTPAALKTRFQGQLRLKVQLEPAAERPDAPGFARQFAVVGRRLLVAIDEAATLEAIEWARALVRHGIAEEYELAPPTLEDTYVSLIRNGSGKNAGGDDELLDDA